MAASYPLAVDQGETFRLSLVYAVPGATPSDPVIPVDITDYKGRMQIREKYGSPVLAEATTENEGISISGPEGRINLVLTDVQTDAMGVKEGSDKPRTAALYDLEIVSPGGDVKRVVEGAITINPNITRDVTAPDAGTGEGGLMAESVVTGGSEAGIFIPDGEDETVVITTTGDPVVTVAPVASAVVTIRESAPGPLVLPAPDSDATILPPTQDNALVVVVPSPVAEGQVLGMPGPAGPPGPPGEPGDPGEVSAVHMQLAPSTEWIITHSLPFFPSVTVVDSAGTMVEGGVEYTSPSSIRLTFSGAFSGIAYLS